MNAKKLLALLLALVMVFALAVSCKGKTEDPSSGDSDSGSDATYDGTQVPDEFVTLHFYYPGEYAARFEEYMNGEYAEMIKTDLNCAIDMQFCGWGDYWTKEATILAAGELIDFYWDGLSDIGKRVSEGYNQPIDELVEKYGYGIKKVMPEEHIATGKVNGKLYGIPGTYAPLALAYNIPTIRTDLMEQAGIEDYPESPADFREYFSAMYDLGYKGSANSMFKEYQRWHEYNDGGNDAISTVVGSTQATAVVESTGEFINNFATDYAYSAFEDLQGDYIAGIIDDDLLVNKSNADARVQSGQFTCIASHSCGKDLEIIDALRGNAPEASLRTYNNVPEATKYKSLSSGECLQIPVSAENPERVIMWLSWLYSDKDHYYASIYGKEGVDFDIEDGVLTRYVSDEFFFEWMFRIGEYMCFAADVPQDYIDWFIHFDDDCEYSKVFGFYFDTKATDELAVAETNLKTVVDEMVYTLQIGMGSSDLKADFDAMVDALEDAGIQIELDEVERQWNEWANA